MTTEQGRWAGRNPDKDVIRHEIWSGLERDGLAVGPAWSMIPNFVGADVAAWHLAQTDEWKAAKTVKTNPDAPQIPIRIRALYEGKLVFAPVPYLTQDFPYLRLDPERLARNGVSFELAATAQGFLEHGERIGLAVTHRGGRTGKGAGFADLETAIFRELGIVSATTPIATTVHSSQLVGEDRVPMQAHDSPLDFVATELELIATGNTAARPMGVDWDRVQPDQFETIPFLRELQHRMLARRAAS